MSFVTYIVLIYYWFVYEDNNNLHQKWKLIKSNTAV